MSETSNPHDTSEPVTAETRDNSPVVNDSGVKVVGQLYPGPRGGMLRFGNPGNKGGTAPPPSLLRERLRGTFAERLDALEAIADGQPMVRVSIPVSAVAGLIRCPGCDQPMKPEPGKGDIEVSVTQSASPKDRLGALEIAAKYGLGSLKEISVESVRERVKDTLDVIRQVCPPDLAARVVLALKPIWTER